MSNTLKRSFNLPDKSVYTGRCLGNGITLGLTEGTNNTGTMETASTGLTSSRTSDFGGNVGATTPTSQSGGIINERLIGITTDASKSGIIVEKDTQLSFIIRY